MTAIKRFEVATRKRRAFNSSPLEATPNIPATKRVRLSLPGSEATPQNADTVNELKPEVAARPGLSIRQKQSEVDSVAGFYHKYSSCDELPATTISRSDTKPQDNNVDVVMSEQDRIAATDAPKNPSRSHKVLTNRILVSLCRFQENNCEKEDRAWKEHFNQRVIPAFTSSEHLRDFESSVCPDGLRIRFWINYLAESKFREAFRVVMEKHGWRSCSDRHDNNINWIPEYSGPPVERLGRFDLGTRSNRRDSGPTTTDSLDVYTRRHAKEMDRNTHNSHDDKSNYAQHNMNGTTATSALGFIDVAFRYVGDRGDNSTARWNNHFKYTVLDDMVQRKILASRKRMPKVSGSRVYYPDMKSRKELVGLLNAYGWVDEGRDKWSPVSAMPRRTHLYHNALRSLPHVCPSPATEISKQRDKSRTAVAATHRALAKLSDTQHLADKKEIRGKHKAPPVLGASKTAITSDRPRRRIIEVVVAPGLIDERSTSSNGSGPLSHSSQAIDTNATASSERKGRDPSLQTGATNTLDIKTIAKKDFAYSKVALPFRNKEPAENVSLQAPVLKTANDAATVDTLIYSAYPFKMTVRGIMAAAENSIEVAFQNDSNDSKVSIDH